MSSTLAGFYFQEWLFLGWRLSLSPCLGWIFVCFHQAPQVLPVWHCIRIISQHEFPHILWVMLESQNPCLYLIKGSTPTTHFSSLHKAEVRQTSLPLSTFFLVHAFTEDTDLQDPQQCAAVSVLLWREPKDLSLVPLYPLKWVPHHHPTAIILCP